ncbi:MAG TPA: MBL fold metallo-hydrolase [Pirellulales bacterium]|nr:MBL fold metallo-hydrolase [Pirellulales bacterium]
MPETFRVETIVSPPFQENTYVANLADRSDCIVIDPGFDVETIVQYLEKQRLTPAAILNTHGHVDHIAGNRELKERWPLCPLVIGRGDAPKLTDSRLNMSAGYGLGVTSPEADVLLDEGQTYSAAGFDLETHEIPGHSVGHVVFIWRASQPMVVFGGDVLFAGSVGRCDFADGNFLVLAKGIHRHLFSLPDDTIVYSGHGPSTTIGEEKRTNPFVGAAADA